MPCLTTGPSHKSKPRTLLTLLPKEPEKRSIRKSVKAWLQKLYIALGRRVLSWLLG